MPLRHGASGRSEDPGNGSGSIVIPGLGRLFHPPALALCLSVHSILFVSSACLSNNYFGIPTTRQAWEEIEVHAEMGD